MDFKTYIEREGVGKLAELCNLTERAVTGWRYRARRPRPDKARILIAASNGELSWSDIYPPPKDDA